jgi:hypothetical protein
MVRTLLTGIVFALTLTASVQGQVTQPGADPQPVPGGPAPTFQPPPRRVGPRVAPSSVRPNSSVPPASGAARQPTLSAFAEPGSLSQRIDYVLSDMGYESGNTFPLTPHTTYDLAYKCYADGRYADAMVFASHGLRMCNDARLHFIKGICELHRGLGSAAERTAVDFRNAVADQQLFGMESVRERINDAMSTRFADIVEYQVTGR